MTILQRPQTRFLIYLVLAALSLGIYQLASARYLRPGFPLDDAWIHQTYARNLALNGEWAFLPGEPSAGSTAPLWSAMLAAGYLFRLSPLTWNYLLGVLVLTGLSWTTYRGLSLLAPGKTNLVFWGGALAALEWHLVWAAGSGMETLLFTLVAAFLLVELLGERWQPLRYGLLSGAALWLRPDGLDPFARPQQYTA